MMWPVSLCEKSDTLLRMDEQKRPKQERRQLIFTQDAMGKLIPKGLLLILEMKT